MTVEEFNEKWSAYLEEGHYGLDINHPDVIEYLDEEFEKLSFIPGFSYSQIKEKFGNARVYLAFGFSEEAHGMEYKINDGWLAAIITYEEEHRPGNFYLPIFRKEVEYRKQNNITI